MKAVVCFSFLLFLLAGLLFAMSCDPPPPECKAFYDLPKDRRQSEFLDYPVEKQIDLYLCGMSRRHPPDLPLAWEIAQGGEKIIPVLLDRIKLEKTEENRQLNLIYVLEVMSQKGYLRGRQDVIDELESIVASMPDEDFRGRARSEVEEIKRANQ